MSSKLNSLGIDSGPSMQNAAAHISASKNQLYRDRLRAAGSEEILLQLPRTTIALLDDLKKRHRLRSRSQALLQLIERGREVTQQIA